MNLIIPRYYCDHCGHAFSTPKLTGLKVINDRDEIEEDRRCPKCFNHDFELLIPENVSTPPNSQNPVHTLSALCS